jgi:UDPglucose 6-dehydrogenase
MMIDTELLAFGLLHSILEPTKLRFVGCECCKNLTICWLFGLMGNFRKPLEVLRMRIAVVGTGYVGLVTAACLAEKRHQVTCMDVDSAKVAQLKTGKVPYYEPGLEEIVQRQVQADTLRFTDSLSSAIADSRIVFITVGTPSGENGSADLNALFNVADEIGRVSAGDLVVVVKSTVPVGTVEAVQHRTALQPQKGFTVLSNPEFLREGRAVHDFFNPHRVIIGGDDEKAIALLNQVYASFVPPESILVMDARSAEMAKYTANAFLATRISFINEIAALCEGLGADVEQVRRAAGMDPRIGSDYLSPGLGYGGSCLPKDLRAVLAMGVRVNMDLDLLGAVQRVNSFQPFRMFQKISDHFEGVTSGRHVTIWGLAFKGGTDDLRESPSIPLIHALVKGGSQVTVYDPKASKKSAYVALGDQVAVSDNQYASIRGADALVVATDWDEFRQADFSKVASQMHSPVIFDGRNVYNPMQMKELGFIYHGIGRNSRQ